MSDQRRDQVPGDAPDPDTTGEIKGDAQSFARPATGADSGMTTDATDATDALEKADPAATPESLASRIDGASGPDRVAIAMLVGIVVLLLVCGAFALAAR